MPKKSTEPEESFLVNDPYDFEKCQIELHFSIQPAEEGQSRQVVYWITSHGDAPEPKFMTLEEFLTKIGPAFITSMLEEFEEKLPGRYLASLRRLEGIQSADEKIAAKAAKPEKKGFRVTAKEAQKSEETQLDLFGGAK